MKRELQIIGHIETPYSSINECPRNISPDGPDCKLIVTSAYQDGMFGLQIGQIILVLYWFDHVERLKLQQKSRKSGILGGVFSLRSPHRPNPIGAAVVKIKTLEIGVIGVNGLDCLNGTPLLDIKPAIMKECFLEA